MEWIFVLIGFLIGYFSNLTVNINKAEKKEEAPTEYNESMVNELPPDVRAYYDKTDGYNKF